MFYDDLFDIEDEPSTYPPGRYDWSTYESTQETRFYNVYSTLMQCHAIVRNGVIYSHTLMDIKYMKPTEQILEISHLDDTHIFNVKSLGESTTKNHSLVIKNIKGIHIEIIPTQLRSMITDGRIS